jgi:hypothetical protein
MTLGLAPPLPCPPTARRPRCKGARNAREPETHPCGAAGASGSHPPLLRFHAKAQRRRREQEIGPMSRGSTPSGRQRTGGYDSHSRASRNGVAPFGSQTNLQSIRSLNLSGPIDSDHSLDATEFLRRSFCP